jgi:hypothetical protein
MPIELAKLDLMKEKEIEKIHDELHISYNKFLAGGKSDYTLREFVSVHYYVYNALIRAGGKHISPIDQLDRVEKLEENISDKEILIKDLKDFDPSKSNDSELMDDHYTTHKWDKWIQLGITLRLLDGTKIGCKEIQRMHHEIVKEMLKREIPHNTPITCKIRIDKEKEFTLKEKYTGAEIYGIKINNKYFEMRKNLLKENISYSVKKKINLKGDLIDKGEFEILEENENYLKVKFLGQELKGIYNFEKNNVNSDIWKVSKEGVNEKLSREFGATLSNNEIREISFLSENGIGASEIANILSRPVQTIYSWIQKLKK